MKRYLLVANGDQSASGYYGEYLSRVGYHVETVGDGLACLNRIRRSPPNLLLLDRQLPWGGGDGVLACIREESALGRIPVVLLTDVLPIRELSLLALPPVVRCLPKQCAVTTLRYQVESALASSGECSKACGSQPSSECVSRTNSDARHGSSTA